MHNWGSRTNGPQGIWGNRGYGSRHVLIPGIAVGGRGAYYSINRDTHFKPEIDIMKCTTEKLETQNLITGM